MHGHRRRPKNIPHQLQSLSRPRTNVIGISELPLQALRDTSGQSSRSVHGDPPARYGRSSYLGRAQAMSYCKGAASIGDQRGEWRFARQEKGSDDRSITMGGVEAGLYNHTRDDIAGFE